MQIITSDGKTLDNFEKIQEIAKKLRGTEAMKASVAKKGGGFVVYGGRSIETSDHGVLSAQIPNVLRDMRLCSWNGKVYSSGSGFEEKFAGYFNFLLAWLESVGLSASVNASVMKDALGWLVSIAKVSMVNTDLGSIKGIIRKL
jgi:hypothetical protein